MQKITFFFFFFFGVVISNYGQKNEAFCAELEALSQTIAELHYQAKPIDDSLSAAVFKLFLENLDEDKRLFNQEQIANFKEKDYLKLDDYIKNNDCRFLNTYILQLEKSITHAKQSLEKLREQPLDFSGTLKLKFSPENEHRYSKNEATQTTYWKKRISYELITNLTEEDSLLKSVKKTLAEEQHERKNKLIDQQLCLLEETSNQFGGLQKFVEKQFLNAFAHYQDPHTTYLDRSDKVSFETHIASNQATFGIYTTKNNDGEIEIAQIVPGSSAFKNNKLEEGDILKKLFSKNDELVVSCVSNREVVNFMNNEDHQETTFKVKKKNGPITNVKLTKTVIKVEENSTRGYLLQHNDKQIGYLKIPGFYTDLESPNGLGVANDVAKEIFKLQQEKIEGLILDLRNNGGGSMKEAITLSGMFIDKGPISIVKTHKGNISTLRDPYRGKVFEKPVLILVNQFSASASELFAGAMQDYHRAIIVGSPTYGKSTVQSIFPLDQNGELGFSKITIQKFYGINGSAHQFKGIQPDIVLPSVYDNLKRSERYLPYALASDSVKIQLEPKKLAAIPTLPLQKNSKQRVSANKSFDTIQKLREVFTNEYLEKETEYALTVENIFNDISAFQKLINQLNEVKTENASYQVKNTSSTNNLLIFNPDDKELNEKITKSIAEDIYIEEAYFILTDFINN
ncbi:carboxy terminal-processing peptidase [Mesonia mobilis]|uniref:carboxy terminal-processing peptidase n=1 Tax=Mesonia mobilis TaxID=369791 RepID=UPI0026EE9B48|nr:carboxy terminal-processing peptidase [Mesonia mobilis]